MTDNQSLNDKLDDYINSNFIVIHSSCGIDADPADGFGKCTCNAEAKAKAQLLTIIESLIDEVIGDDANPDNAKTDRLFNNIVGGNIVRKLQRTRATSLLKALKENQ